MFCTQRS